MYSNPHGSWTVPPHHCEKTLEIALYGSLFLSPVLIHWLCQKWRIRSWVLTDHTQYVILSVVVCLLGNAKRNFSMCTLALSLPYPPFRYLERRRVLWNKTPIKIPKRTSPCCSFQYFLVPVCIHSSSFSRAPGLSKFRYTNQLVLHLQQCSTYSTCSIPSMLLEESQCLLKINGI